jgi:hypothetical protein
MFAVLAFYPLYVGSIVRNNGLEMTSVVLNKKLSHPHVIGICKGPSYRPLAGGSCLQTSGLDKNCYPCCQLRVNY